MKPADFKAWLIDQKKTGFLDFLLGEIETRANALTTAALQDGDTNFDKGQVAALRWVLNQPEELAGLKP